MPYYLLYRFFMKYPVAIVFVVLSQSCFVSSVEIEIEEVTEAELYIGISEESNIKTKKCCILDEDRMKGAFASNQQIETYDNPYSRAEYHELYILYLNVAMGKTIDNC